MQQISRPTSVFITSQFKTTCLTINGSSCTTFAPARTLTAWEQNGHGIVARCVCYYSDDGLGTQASCLPFASGASQTTVAKSYPENQVSRSPPYTSGVSRARGKRDTCAPVSRP